MQPAVRSYFQEFNRQFEGFVNVMYLDTHNPPLVTTGVGNLIDPIEEAVKLPWMSVMGQPVSETEIRDEWYRVKSATAHSNDHISYWQMTAKLKLLPDAINFLILSKLDWMESVILHRPEFSGFSSYPAEAQLGILSMAWAAGPSFNFPRFEAACSRMDFTTAEEECALDETHNPGLKPRNIANQKLFRNAQLVLQYGLGKTKIWYPNETAPAPSAPSDHLPSIT
jgi:hypothetical protein